jgi:hypothetical protein
MKTEPSFRRVFGSGRDVPFRRQAGDLPDLGLGVSMELS